MKNIIKRIVSFTIVLTVLIGIQSFINPNPEPISLAHALSIDPDSTSNKQSLA